MQILISRYKREIKTNLSNSHISAEWMLSKLREADSFIRTNTTV